MLCPSCRSQRSRVLDSRTVESGSAIRRRRECTRCGTRFTTIERSVLLVTKRNGVTEEFSRDKVIRGVGRACQGLSVSEDDLKVLAHEVEQSIRATHGSQVAANDIGLAILDPLRKLDEVAYLRFASVYKSFRSAEDFENEIRMLRDQHSDSGRHPDSRSGSGSADDDRAPETGHRRQTPVTGGKLR